MLVPERRAVPLPGDGEVLVKVAAAGVNRPDVMQRQGHYPPPEGAPDIPVSRSPARWWRSAPASSDGSSATRSWRWWSAAATPNIAWRTRAIACRCRRPVAHRSRRDPGNLLHRLVQRRRARPPQARRDLLVHGGSSGIRTAAIQLARELGARVITTAGSAEKLAVCRRLGAAVAVNYKTEDFVAATKAATDGKGADVILDMVGGDYAEQLRGRRGRGPRGADRLSRRPQGDGRFPPPDVQTSPTPAPRCAPARSSTRPRSRARSKTTSCRCSPPAR